MKIRHNPNASWAPPSAVVSESYEDEVLRSTEKAERLYRQAQKRLADAEGRLARAQRKASAKNRKRHLAELEAIVELRRVELEKYRRLMVSTAASAAHRGRDSFRPVGLGGTA